MKKNIIKSLASIAAIGALSACSSDYLDLAPKTNVSVEDVKDTKAAQLAINGICFSMNCQYSKTNYNQYSGEAYINTVLNDAFGQDEILGLGLNMFGAQTVNGESWDGLNGYVFSFLPWDYCYNLIKQANLVLSSIDVAEENGAQDRNFVKGEALTFRAFGYTKLLSYYAPRWEDSNNGASYCVVLRTDPDIQDVPLSTMGQCLDLIYKDLDDAIACFKASASSRDYKWQPDLSVAYGVYARAALIKNDWAKAQEMAHNARQGYKVMDNDTYLGGFFADNDDFMWCQSDDPSTIYYWSHGSHFAVNGTYVYSWGVGGGAIDMSLYRQLDENDIRRKCFLTPDKFGAIESKFNPGKLTEADWWNADLVDASNYMNLASGPTAKGQAINGKWGMYNFATYFCREYGNNFFTGNISAMNNDGQYAYYKSEKDGKINLGGGVKVSINLIPFGAQFKFWAIPPYGTSKYPFMRASEMVLAEAEAAYHNQDFETAKKCLAEINKLRIPGYECTSEGEALLEEIRLCRRIELWGEGQNWTDFKRWNLPIKRVVWEEGNTASGNWPSEYAVEIPVNANFGWRFPVPKSESQYNKDVDRSLLNQ